MSEAYYLWPAPGTSFPDEALDEWRQFLAPKLTVPRAADEYWWFADAALAEGFRQSSYPMTEGADLIALAHDQVEIDASYVHEEPELAALGAFLTGFVARWPATIAGPSRQDMTVDDFVAEYRAVAR